MAARQKPKGVVVVGSVDRWIGGSAMRFPLFELGRTGGLQTVCTPGPSSFWYKVAGSISAAGSRPNHRINRAHDRHHYAFICWPTVTIRYRTDGGAPEHTQSPDNSGEAIQYNRWVYFKGYMSIFYLHTLKNVAKIDIHFILIKKLWVKIFFFLKIMT